MGAAVRHQAARLYTHLVDLATRNKPAPTNEQIAFVLGCDSGGSAQKILNYLVDHGRINMAIIHNRRWIKISASGLSTMIPEDKSPKKKTRLAKSKAKNDKRDHKGKIQLDIDQGRDLLPSNSVVVFPTYDCQYPFGDPKHRDFHLCGAETAPGSSYCQPHHDQCYTKWKDIKDARKEKAA